MPPSRMTLAFVSPLAVTLMMPGCATNPPITSAGFFDDASKSMSPITSLNRRKLPAALQRIGGAQCVVEQMFRGVSTATLDAFENIRLRLFTKTVEIGNYA